VNTDETQKKHDSPGVREIVLVMGMTGWGKSWWTKLYHQTFSRSLVYDPSMSFPCQKFQPIEDTTAELLDSDEPPQTFNIGFVDGEECEAAGGLAFCLGNNVLVIEECATVFEKGLLRMPRWTKRICFFGRHQNCSLVLIAQRPVYIPIDFRSQANRVVTFCQHEGSDTAWLGDFFGRERMQRLPTLEKFSCFDYHNGVVTEYSIREKVRQEFGVLLDTHIDNSVELVL
jgi:hypothetical protein